MSTIHSSALAAKVAARNKVNAEAMRLSREMRATFEPLLGQKVASVHGYLVKKYEHLQPKGDAANQIGWPSGTFSVHQSNGYKSLGFCVRVHECTEGRFLNGQPSGSQIAHYAEATFTVGDIDERGYLMKLAAPFTARTDYSEESIRLARQYRDELESKLRAVQGEISEFGRWDN